MLLLAVAILTLNAANARAQDPSDELHATQDPAPRPARAAPPAQAADAALGLPTGRLGLVINGHDEAAGGNAPGARQGYFLDIDHITHDGDEARFNMLIIFEPPVGGVEMAATRMSLNCRTRVITRVTADLYAGDGAPRGHMAQPSSNPVDSNDVDPAIAVAVCKGELPTAVVVGYAAVLETERRILLAPVR